MLIDAAVASFRNLGRKRFRSFLTVASIAIGVASVVLIGSIGEIGKGLIQEELSALGLGSVTISVDNKLTDVRMTREDLELLRARPEVESASPIVYNYTNATMRGLIANVMVFGMDERGGGMISLAARHGRLIGSNDIAGAREVCVVDSKMAQVFYKRENIVGKQINILLHGSYVPFEIVGVASSGGSIMQNMVGDVIPSFAYIPYTTLQKYAGDSTFEQVAVTLSPDTSPEIAASQLEAVVNRSHSLSRGFKADNVSAQKETLNNVMELITQVLSAIAGISLVVSGLGIMTVMIVSVNERTREIGIKKSIGATRATIMLEFLFEAFTISLLGGAIGLVLGLSAVWGGCMLLSITPILDWRFAASSLLLAVGVGMAFGVYPSALAARLRPVDALRIE